MLDGRERAEESVFAAVNEGLLVPHALGTCR